MTLVVCANADGSNKIPCCMIGKSKIPACSIGKHWPIPYCSQHKAWMDQPTYQKWFDAVFLPEVQKHTGSPLLLLLDNAPGHFNALQKDGTQVELFSPNCTSLKQPCDQGIINALKARYKFLYLRDVLHFYDLPEDKKESLQTLGTHLRSGSAGVEYGNLAHLMDAAK